MRTRGAPCVSSAIHGSFEKVEAVVVAQRIDVVVFPPIAHADGNGVYNSRRGASLTCPGES